MNLSDVIEATVSNSAGPQIIQQEHDGNKITWQNGVFDKCEMNGRTGIAAGLRRANLGITNGKINFMSARVVPWTGLGVVIDRNATLAETLQLASLAGWDLAKIQHYIEAG